MTGLFSLPNLHPAVVHFPIALLPAAWLLELAGSIRRRDSWARHAAVALYWLATASAIVAYFAGRSAEDSLVDVPSSAQRALASHADAALVALALVTALAVLRSVVAVRERRRGDVARRLSAVVGLVGGLAATVALGIAADRGGALVYRHGRAVAPTVFGRGTNPPAIAPSAAVAAPPKVDPSSRIVEVDGVAWLRLPEAADDATFEADLDLGAFEGAVELRHHAADDATGGAFEVTGDGRARLLDRRNGREKVLDEKAVGTVADRIRLQVSSAGRHIKGMVDGRAVVHGHSEPGPGRGFALRFQGRGRVRVLAVQVVPRTSSTGGESD